MKILDIILGHLKADIKLNSVRMTQELQGSRRITIIVNHKESLHPRLIKLTLRLYIRPLKVIQTNDMRQYLMKGITTHSKTWLPLTSKSMII